MHLSICDACTNFNGQMQLLRKAMHRVALDPDPTNATSTDPKQR